MQKKILNLIYILTLAAMVSCTGKSTVQDITDPTTIYASLLQMQNLDNGIVLCRIANPWKTEETIVQYLLVPSGFEEFDPSYKKELEEEYGESEIIRTPLQRMTLTASCHGYLLDQIDASGNIAVYCDADYVTFNGIRALLDNNSIVNGGNSMAPNIETILSKQSDAIWISPFENASAGNIESLPIPIIYCADYMETSPLGRAEWMKFYGRLVDKAALADSLFNLVVNRYDSIKHVGLGFESQPDHSLSLMSELPYQATWYVPGGSSTMGILYKDAGYDYPWAEDNHSGSLALSSEIVLSKAQDTDIWVFKYYEDHEYTLDELKSQNKFYSQFKAAKEGNVFGCNTSLTDYYDVVPFRPDILLEEIKNIGEGKYFKKLD